MAITPVSSKVENNNKAKSISKKVAFGKLSSKPDSFSSKNQKENVAFGSLGNALKDGATGIFRYIDNSSFFVEFLIVDTISLILPRIWIGLNRDKEELGHLNYKAGKEEAGREILSGPSMNLIPMGILTAVSAAVPASHMEKDTLQSLTHHMSRVIKKTSTEGNSEELTRQLANRVVGDAIGKSHPARDELSDILVEASKHRPKSWIERKIFGQADPFREAQGKFVQRVIEINNAAKEAPLSPSTLGITIEKGADKKPISAGVLFEDFRNYHRDIVKKLTSSKIKGTAAEFLSKATNNRLLLKTATAFTAFMAVGAFLLYLPKLYQQGNVSPAQESAQRAKNAKKEVQHESA